MSEQPLPAPESSSGTSAKSETQYEFSPGQNKVFEDLSENLTFAGWFVIIVVVVFHAVLLGRWAVQGKPMYDRFRLVQILFPLLLVYCSWQFTVTGRAFRKVVDTQGSDITHLMDGLRSLNDAFTWLTFIPRIWVLVAFIAAAIGLVFAVIHWLGY